jgi:hypothetical protein
VDGGTDGKGSVSRAALSADSKTLFYSMVTLVPRFTLERDQRADEKIVGPCFPTFRPHSGLVVARITGALYDIDQRRSSSFS